MEIVRLGVGALLTGTAALAGTGLWYLSTVRLVPVNEEEGYDETYKTENTIGKKYGRYFLSSKNNQKEGESRHESNKEQFKSIKGKFKDVVKGFPTETSDNTTLSKVCENAYGETTSGNLVDNDESDKYQKRNIGKFCGLYEVVTVDEDDKSKNAYESKHIGGDTTNKKLFVSVKESNNDWFGKIKFDEFMSSGDLKGKDKSDNEFQKLKNEENKSGIKLKNACEKAYNKESTSDTSNKNKEDAEAFCSIKLDI